MPDHYWIKKNSEDWKEVTLQAYLATERMCGFYPKEGEGPATGDFMSVTTHGEIRGTITTKDGELPDDPIDLKMLRR